MGFGMLRRLGVDSAVAWTGANRAFALARGPLIALFQIMFLTPEQQGVWYAFISLSALTVFAELGFAQIITQFVSHEYARLKFDGRRVSGAPRDVDRLFGLIRYAARFYLAAVPAAAILLFAAGAAFFRAEPAAVLAAWFLYALAGGLNLLTALLQAIYQGMDRVAQVQRNMLKGSVLMAVSSLAFLALGFGVWALAASTLVGCAAWMALLYAQAPSFWKQAARHRINVKYRWFSETARLQLKYAVSWVSGYFIIQLYVPVIFRVDGSVLSGQMGISLWLVAAVAGVAHSWADSRIPALNILAAQGEHRAAYRMFIRLFAVSAAVCALGFLSLLAALTAMPHIGLGAASERFLGPASFAKVLSFQFAAFAVAAAAKYLRSDKGEPLFPLSVVNAAAVAVLVLGAYPVLGFGALLNLTNVLYWAVIIPAAVVVFIRYRDGKLRG
jgi:hypothetical protein